MNSAIVGDVECGRFPDAPLNMEGTPISVFEVFTDFGRVMRLKARTKSDWIHRITRQNCLFLLLHLVLFLNSDQGASGKAFSRKNR